MQQFFPDGGDFQVGVWSDKGVEAVYIEGDKLVLRIQSEISAYLLVDYYQSDGNVVHLLPNSVDRNVVEAGKAFVIGKSPEGYQFVVTPPFGQELLTVIASPRPLEADIKRNIEPASVYLARLTQSLRRLKTKGQVAGAHTIIVTRQR